MPVSSESTMTTSAVLPVEVDLHARPAGRFVREASRFVADIVEGYGIVESRVEMLRKPFGPRELRDKVSHVLGARDDRWVSCQSAA